MPTPCVGGGSGSIHGRERQEGDDLETSRGRQGDDLGTNRRQMGDKKKTNRGHPVSFDDELKRFKSGTKAKRLRQLWPTIQTALADGLASHSEIRELLKQHGLDLRPETYRTYVRRMRKSSGRTKLPVQQPTALAAPERRAPPQRSGSATPEPQRPRTFNFDPRGNPDLLK